MLPPFLCHVTVSPSPRTNVTLHIPPVRELDTRQTVAVILRPKMAMVAHALRIMLVMSELAR